MNDLLDRAVRSALQDFFDAAPERPTIPSVPAPQSPRARPPRLRSMSRASILAAASVVVIGIGGLVAVRVADRESGRGAATTPDSNATEGTPTTVIVTQQSYVVVAGDFLSAIAERHCVTMEAIAVYNNWPGGADQPLFPGDTILIPPGACVPSATVPPTNAPTSTVALIEQTYEVVTGDSLFDIASLFGLTAEELANFNDWPDGVGHALLVGDVIRVPPGDSTAGSATLPASLILLGPPLLARRRWPRSGRPMWRFSVPRPPRRRNEAFAAQIVRADPSRRPATSRFRSTTTATSPDTHPSAPFGARSDATPAQSGQASDSA